MRLTNARHSIHDAFAVHLGGPTDNMGGGTKFNSNKWLEKAGTAGLVIRAVMNQPAHLRGTAIFLNAPENTITLGDMIAMKSGLWAKFITKNQVSPADQGILIAYFDRILMGYRSRAWDHNSKQHTAGAMFADYSQERSDRLTNLSNLMLDVLHSFDTASQAPVWQVIDSEKSKDGLKNCA